MATYGLPVDVLRTIQVLISGTPQQVTTGLRSYLAGGARHLVCRIAALDLRTQRDQLERITEIARTLRHSIVGVGGGTR